MAYDPCLLNEPLKKEQWGMFHEITLTLNAQPSCSYSIKYRNLIESVELEKMLCWQLLMLKRRFFENYV